MGTTSFASFAIREALIEAMVGDLLGPADGEDEIVDEQNVRGRYLVGILAPPPPPATPVRARRRPRPTRVPGSTARMGWPRARPSRPR